MSKIWRYFTKNNTLKFVDVLDDFVHVYNHTPHRSIGLAPLDVTSQNKAKVWYRLYADPVPYKEAIIKVGDSVRISKARRTFKKGYLPKWTEEIFQVVRLKPTQPPTFLLQDYNGEQLKGSFYAAELQKVSKLDEVYKIDSILKRKKDKVFVKWKGYPDKFNSWVSTKDLIWTQMQSSLCSCWMSIKSPAIPLWDHYHGKQRGKHMVLLWQTNPQRRSGILVSSFGHPLCCVC